MANGTMPGGSPSAMPGWLQAAAQLTTTVGVPTVFAAYLLWFVTTRVGATLEVIESNERVRTKLIEDTQAAFVMAIERSADRFDKAIDKNIAVNRELAERYRRSTGP